MSAELYFKLLEPWSVAIEDRSVQLRSVGPVRNPRVRRVH